MTELLLVGAGHAHLYLVKHAAALLDAGYRVHLLAPRYFHYSGVASASAAGPMAPDEGRINVAALARRSGVTFHEGTLASLDLARRLAGTSDRREIGYDVLSLNIGSVVASPGFPVDPQVLRTKPLGELGRLGARLAAAAEPVGAHVTVVGAGASGLELAAHLTTHRDVGHVRLLEAGPEIGADLPRRARGRVLRLLADEGGAEVRTGFAVSSLGASVARGRDGEEVAHDVAVLATGLAASPLVGQLGLGTAAGVPVRETLQHVDHDEIYAAGDCAHFVPQPLPRIGVHGVKQAPVLHRSLLARAAGESLPVYRPQRRALSVLDLGGGTGLATWGRAWWMGRSALRLKRAIDRRWLRRYQG